MTKPGANMLKSINKAGWTAISAVALAVVIASMVFALTTKTSTTPPSSLPNGDVQPQSSVAVIDNCLNVGRIEPASIVLYCGTGAGIANGLIWSQWTADKAVGRGTVNLVDCNPNCANGPDVAYQISLTLSEPVRAASGARYFTRVTVSFLSKAPAGVARTAVFKECFDTPPAPDLPKCPADEQGAT
jgi:hypothetical protein